MATGTSGLSAAGTWLLGGTFSDTGDKVFPLVVFSILGFFNACTAGSAPPVCTLLISVK